MLEVKRTTTKTYQITDATWPTPFSNYGDAEDRAKEIKQPLETRGLSKCFVCHQVFKREDDVYLAMVKGYKNVFLCGDCAMKV